MRVSRQAFDTHHAAILDAAGRLFRSRGVAAVSLGEVSREAGLTHGAFYGHYPSKTALVEASCRAAFARGAEAWRCRAEAARAGGGSGLEAIVSAYLSEAHRDAPDQGCALAALGQELARGDPATRRALGEGVAELELTLADEVGMSRPDLTPEACERIARGMLSAMAGGLMLSRCLTDLQKSTEALLAARAAAHAALVATDLGD